MIDTHRTRCQGSGLRLLVVAALSLVPAALLAQTPHVRLVDNDVKHLMEQVEDHRGEFQDHLDSSIKDSKLRSPDGEVDVSAYLKDYEDSVHKMKDRFNDDYAASTEVQTVLRQASAIDRHMHAQAMGTKGRSEWDREAASLKTLADAYGATFPLTEGAPVRRYNDKEVAKAADDLANAADHFKDNVDKSEAVSKSDREAAKKDADDIKKLADDVKSRCEDGKPATAEFDQLSTLYSRVQSWVSTHPAPLAAADWTNMQTHMDVLRRAFGAR
jgi:hypothetical protein